MANSTDSIGMSLRLERLLEMSMKWMLNAEAPIGIRIVNADGIPVDGSCLPRTADNLVCGLTREHITSRW